MSGEPFAPKLAANKVGDLKIIKLGDSVVSSISDICKTVSEARQTTADSEVIIAKGARHQEMYSMPFFSQILKMIQ